MTDKDFKQPEMFIFAGTNGSGKSSFLETQLPKDKDITFHNPDKITFELELTKQKAKGLSDEEAHNTTRETVSKSNLAKLAGIRKYRSAMTDSMGKGESFTAETALDNEAYESIIAKAHQHGYKTHLWYVGTESAEINISRVEDRVGKKGHNVAIEDILKRYEGGLNHLKNYSDMVNGETRVYDNSIDRKTPTLQLHIENGKIITQAPEEEMLRWVKENIYSENVAELKSDRQSAIEYVRTFPDTDIVMAADAAKGNEYTGKILGEHGDYIIQHIKNFTTDKPENNDIKQYSVSHIAMHRKEDLLNMELSLIGQQVTISRGIDGKSNVLQPAEKSKKLPTITHDVDNGTSAAANAYTDSIKFFEEKGIKDALVFNCQGQTDICKGEALGASATGDERFLVIQSSIKNEGYIIKTDEQMLKDLEANNTDKEMLFSVENGLLASIDEPPAIEAVMTEREEHEIEIDDDRYEGRN